MARQWWWVLVLAAGSLLAAVYVLRILRSIFAATPDPSGARAPVAMEWTAIALALGAIGLGLAFGAVECLLAVGAPSATGPGGPGP